MKPIDWVTILILGVMLIAVVVAVQYVYNIEVRECIQEPLSYAARQLEDQYGFPFAGSGAFVMEGGSPITIYFDADGIDSQSNIYNPNFGSSELVWGNKT